MTINLLRYSAAKTKAAVIAEIAQADSRDQGIGTKFDGLCVAVEAGQDFDPASLLDPLYRDPTRRYQLDLDGCVSAASTLATYLHTQGVTGRTMWRIAVDSDDLIGLAGREMGMPTLNYVGEYFADGVILRPGAKITSVARVKV